MNQQQTTPAWKTPLQQRSRERFDRILDVAGQLLDDGGMSNLTMDKVASGAETSIGSVYHFFPDRETLIAALVEHRSIKMMELFAVSSAALALPIETAFSRMFYRLTELMDSQPGVKSLYSMTHSAPEIHQARQAFLSKFKKMSGQYLAEKLPELSKQERSVAATVCHHSVESFALLIASQPRSQRRVYARHATKSLVAYLQSLGKSSDDRHQHTGDGTDPKQ